MKKWCNSYKRHNYKMNCNCLTLNMVMKMLGQNKKKTAS